jgi:apolipoprotein D and lipocalin family protein
MLFFAVGTIWSAKPVSAADGKAPLKVVPSVDLSRYAGKWYEIARLPNRFQRDCASNTTATYSLRPDGKITVINECRTTDGRTRSANGTARVADATGPNTKLKVTFFWPFSGNYWIIGLDSEYRWAVVGEPGRDYLLILSREPRLDAALYAQLTERVRAQGFDTAKLIKTAPSSADRRACRRAASRKPRRSAQTP